MSKKAIAVISFGTTYLDTAEKTIHAVEKDIAVEFPEYEITSAYTSSLIRNALSKEGINVPSPHECFENLLENGCKEVIVLPTHIIGGEEYSKVVECVREFSSRFDSIKVCRPLIEKQDVTSIVDTILEVFAIPQDSYMVFMGHGSSTQSNEIYHLINEEFSTRGVKNMYMATVEATPELLDAVHTVREYPSLKEVILTPFMLVAGEHANNDMNISWKNVFEDAKLNPRCIIKGLGEYPEFRKIYLERVKEVLC